ncbi:transcription antitermination factor NusB [Mucisphaera sp.]|uniref:transcription antitermination factor NusB n=1 Tax=Mucisphaera sp. TaxID=2913024 RepID=UPI003D11548B
MKQQARLIRRLAMQLLYQIDVTSTLDPEALYEGIADTELCADEKHTAVDLAVAAWNNKQTADEQFTKLAPDWPTHRQPPVDRAILRLAHHEITTARVSDRIAINEAVELAKDFCTEESPAFINALLDKATHNKTTPTADSKPRSTPDPASSTDPTTPTPDTNPNPPSESAWLEDALNPKS